jgi:hypothetical protein
MVSVVIIVVVFVLALGGWGLVGRVDKARVDSLHARGKRGLLERRKP